MCIAYPQDLTNCAAIFRNPSGTPAQENEYLYVGHRVRLEFSAVK